MFDYGFLLVNCKKFKSLYLKTLYDLVVLQISAKNPDNLKQYFAIIATKNELIENISRALILLFSHHFSEGLLLKDT